MAWTNYHGHCHYCDGKLPPEEHVRQAIRNGMPALGISSHAPVDFSSSWAMPPRRLPDYVAEMRQLRAQYADQIQLYMGLEVDYIPHRIQVRSPHILAAGLDYTVGSVHFVDAYADGTPWEIDGPHAGFLKGLHAIFGGDAVAVVKRFYALNREMIREGCPDVVGHLDKIKMQSEGGVLFDEHADWYRAEVLATLEEIQTAGTIVEVNTRGAYKKRVGGTYPSPWILERMFARKIPVCLNSDAHHPDELERDFDIAAAQLLQIGYRELWVLLDGEWQARPFGVNGLQQ